MNTYNTEINGKKLRIKPFAAQLYRADDKSYMPGVTANILYKGAPMKYFTIRKGETSAYTKYGRPYIKTWQPVDTLHLVDILHTPTRKALESLIDKNALNTAFPLKGNDTARYSNINTKTKNDLVLKGLCDLGLDGYFMDTLYNKNNTYVFHSEVGLCPPSLAKITLVEIEKNRSNPPQLDTRKRRRTYKNNRNNSNNRTNRNYTFRISSNY